MNNHSIIEFKEILNLIPPVIKKHTKQAQKAVPLSEAEKDDIANVLNLDYQNSVRLLKKYVSPSRFKPREQKDEYLIKAIYFVTYRLYVQYYGFTDAERVKNTQDYNNKRKYQNLNMNGEKMKVPLSVYYRYKRLNEIGIDADYIIDNEENSLFISRGLVKFYDVIPYEILPIDFQTRVLMDLGMYRINENPGNGAKKTIGSKNTWTKWGISPQKDYEKNYYTPVKILFYYNGKKHNELGYMLNSLVRQSGANYFYDLFGGSGTATLSVAPLKYNYLSDIEANIYNFYNVLKTKCNAFKCELSSLIEIIEKAPQDDIFILGKAEVESRFINRVKGRIYPLKYNLEKDISEQYPEIIPLAKEKYLWRPRFNSDELAVVEDQLKTLRKLIELLPEGETKNYYLYSRKKDLNSYVDETSYALDYLEKEYFERYKNPEPRLVYSLGVYRLFTERDNGYFQFYKNNYLALSKANGIAEDAAVYINYITHHEKEELLQFTYPNADIAKAVEFYYVHCFDFSGSYSIAGVEEDTLSEFKVSLNLEEYRNKSSDVIKKASSEEIAAAERLIRKGISGLEIASERLQQVELNLSEAYSVLYKTLENVTKYSSLRVDDKKLTLSELRNLGVLDREECLFYADPPYPGTVEYRTNTATEDATRKKDKDSFDFDMFYQDIQRLKYAKWIVSCEAGVSKRTESEANETSKARIFKNATKVRDFFHNFKGYAKYVVFPISQSAHHNKVKYKKSNDQFAIDFLTMEIRQCNKVEVMLTNFEFNCPDQQFSRSRGCESDMDYTFSRERNLGYCKIDYELFYSTVVPLLSHLIERNKPEIK